MKSKTLFILLLTHILTAVVAGVVVYYSSSDSSDKPNNKTLVQKNTNDRKSARTNNRSANVARNNLEKQITDNENNQPDTKNKEIKQQFANFANRRAQRDISRLTEVLNLSEEQQKMLQAQAEKNKQITNKFFALGEKIAEAHRNNDSDTVAALQKEMAALHEENKNERLENYVGNILTSEQKAQYEQYTLERTKTRAEAEATMKLVFLQDSVSLTEDQKNAYFQALTTARINGENVSDDTVLKNILTNDQYSKWKETSGNSNFGGRGRARTGNRNDFRMPPPPLN